MTLGFDEPPFWTRVWERSRREEAAGRKTKRGKLKDKDKDKNEDDDEDEDEDEDEDKDEDEDEDEDKDKDRQDKKRRWLTQNQQIKKAPWIKANIFFCGIIMQMMILTREGSPFP